MIIFTYQIKTTIMKVIYMEQTLNLIAAQNLELTKSIISTGIVKQSEVGTYLLIETKEE